ncbi:raffinose/stachyose/melibiose transport system substrate-binding protein [Pseudarthrobacter sp. W1I19]|uniref:ABC transporter substrate-binding protein n=1 Tax=Pseudarthrobacter sp. W1I19 TaxID=3042288 RepID=UPI00277F5B21|nr:extracellular solute-binding protein [Pseudarthrobacter sp. W1I19]MDQ0923884.1 raffinose/stachyose/melibiose transport system substrate-binding protein [Pseudarthrobacter sp. W1I19]
MKFSRRLAGAAATLLLATAGMTGCSTGGSSTGSAEGETINVLGYQPIPQTILDDFKNKTGITVKLDQQGGGDFAQILQSRVSAKADIDVLNVRAGAEFNKYAKANTFEDLTGQAFLNNVDDIGLKPGEVDGKTFGYSQSSYVTGVFYNKDMFEKLGIDVPKSWDELTTAAAKIKAAGTAPFVFTAADAWTNQYFYHNAVAIYAQEHPSFMEDLATGKAKWQDNNLFTRQVQRFQDLVKKDYFVPGANSLPGQEGQNVFASGKAAMYLMGTWTLSSLTPQGFEMGMFPLPINEPGQPPAVASSLSDNMYSVTSWSKKKDAAEKFLDFLTQKESAIAYSEANKNASTIKGAVGNFSPYQADSDALTKAAAPYPTNIGPSVNGTGPSILGEIIAGTASADDAVKKFQALQDDDNQTDYNTP